MPCLKPSRNTNSDPNITRYERTDPHSAIGDSQNPNRVGYGIDCSGFVGEVARICGRGNGDMGSGTLKTTPLSATVADAYLRAGDYIAWKGHIIYLREAPMLKKMGDDDVIDTAVTIEAKPNKVQQGSYLGDYLRSKKSAYRRWRAP